VLKKIHGNLQISTRAVRVLNDMCLDLLDRFATEAAHFSRVGNMATLNSRHVLYAVRSLIEGQELRKHAQHAGCQRTHQYLMSLQPPSE
jgi:hypothetical protein